MSTIETYFDDYTLKVAKDRLLIKFEDGVWKHYTLGLAADMNPDTCGEEDKDGVCPNECWQCSRVAPWITMWATAIDDPDDVVCINDEFCEWDEVKNIYEELKANKKIYPDVQMHGVRHGDDADIQLGVELTQAGFLVNRVGWVLSIPRPTVDVDQISLDVYEEHGL